jgi:hypothetical protein
MFGSSLTLVALVLSCLCVCLRILMSYCQFEFRSWRGVLVTTLCDKVVSDLRQVGGFLWILRFSPSIKLTATITEILLKVALRILIRFSFFDFVVVLQQTFYCGQGVLYFSQINLVY